MNVLYISMQCSGTKLINMKKITFDEWWDKYKPVDNHFENDDSQLYETYGQDIDYVSKTIPNENIWTLIDGDHDTQWILPGFHIVNRIGFYVTEVPWEDVNIEVDCNESLYPAEALEVVTDYLDTVGIKLTEDQTFELEDRLKNH